ncbi:hypothetical protein ACP70R_006086 [Stipagrostis hirtigluma subsp. patula]
MSPQLSIAAGCRKKTPAPLLLLVEEGDPGRAAALTCLTGGKRASLEVGNRARIVSCGVELSVGGVQLRCSGVLFLYGSIPASSPLTADDHREFPTLFQSPLLDCEISQSQQND